eukprot:2943830-Alexandrium_andersonii.AAC.1
MKQRSNGRQRRSGGGGRSRGGEAQGRAARQRSGGGRAKQLAVVRTTRQQPATRPPGSLGSRADKPTRPAGAAVFGQSVCLAVQLAGN